MVDLHCHILPATDDGPKTVEESLAMLRLAADSGTTDLVATPHADLRFRFDPERARADLARLQALHGPVPRLHLGCDFHLFLENIQRARAKPEQYCINGHNYLLVEFADQGLPANMGRALDELLDAGITPIITHPERTICLQRRKDLIGVWVRRGSLVQITAQSFLGRFGRTAKAIAEELMAEDLVHVVASDGHDVRHRPPVLQPSYEYMQKRWGACRATQVFIETPQRILQGEPIKLKKGRRTGELRLWFRFGA